MNKEKREKALEEARKQLKNYEERDIFIAKAVELLDSMEESFQDRMENFRQLYSIYFPELEQKIGDDEELVKILSRGLRKNELDSFQELAENSTGAELPEKELDILERSFQNLREDREFRNELEEELREMAEEEMTNLSALLDPLLASKLVALSGGLEDLAKSPASTIQMLGAEKALFRYLGGKGTPPKHGVLFHHNFVSKLPEENRGKMARFLANKAAMAARLDFYGDKDKSEKLREEAREKFEELEKNE